MPGVRGGRHGWSPGQPGRGFQHLAARPEHLGEGAQAARGGGRIERGALLPEARGDRVRLGEQGRVRAAPQFRAEPQVDGGARDGQQNRQAQREDQGQAKPNREAHPGCFP